MCPNIGIKKIESLSPYYIYKWWWYGYTYYTYIYDMKWTSSNDQKAKHKTRMIIIDRKIFFFWLLLFFKSSSFWDYFIYIHTHNDWQAYVQSISAPIMYGNRKYTYETYLFVFFDEIFSLFFFGLKLLSSSSLS